MTARNDRCGARQGFVLRWLRADIAASPTKGWMVMHSSIVAGSGFVSCPKTRTKRLPADEALRRNLRFGLSLHPKPQTSRYRRWVARPESSKGGLANIVRH